MWIHSLLVFLSSLGLPGLQCCGIEYDHPHLIWWSLPSAAAAAGLIYVRWLLLRKDVHQWGDDNLVLRYTPLPSRASLFAQITAVVSVVVLLFGTATMAYLPVESTIVPASNVHVALAVDASRSMGATDLSRFSQDFGGPPCQSDGPPCGRRIDIAKLIILKQILPALTGNQVGLVVYSGGYVVRSFLTDDFDPLTEILTTWKWVDIGSALGQGSYVDQGIAGAVHVLQHYKPKPGDPPPQNVILLFTDGGNDSSIEALKKAEPDVFKLHARLIVIEIGSAKPAPIPLWDQDDKPIYEKDGQRAYFKGADGQIIATAREDCNRDTSGGADDKSEQRCYLADLAARTGGRVIVVEPGKPVTIDWPAALTGTKQMTGKYYLYRYPLAAAIVILTLLWSWPLWLTLWAALSAPGRFAARRRRRD